LSGNATFLQRLLVGWKSSGVKLVPFGESRRIIFAVKRYKRGSAAAHAQGLFHSHHLDARGVRRLYRVVND